MEIQKPAVKVCAEQLSKRLTRHPLTGCRMASQSSKTISITSLLKKSKLRQSASDVFDRFGDHSIQATINILVI